MMRRPLWGGCCSPTPSSFGEYENFPVLTRVICSTRQRKGCLGSGHMSASGCRGTRGSRLQWSVLTALEDGASATGLEREMVSNIMLQVTCNLKYEQISSSSLGGTRFRAIWHILKPHIYSEGLYLHRGDTYGSRQQHQTYLLCLGAGTAVRVTLDGKKLGQPWKGAGRRTGVQQSPGGDQVSPMRFGCRTSEALGHRKCLKPRGGEKSVCQQGSSEKTTWEHTDHVSSLLCLQCLEAQGPQRAPSSPPFPSLCKPLA